MKVKGVSYKTIWFDSTNNCIKIIDQSVLPHKFRILDLVSLDDAVCAISRMKVRGAPLTFILDIAHTASSNDTKSNILNL